MDIFIIVLIITGIIIYIGFRIHFSKELTEAEVDQLARSRRVKYVHEHFSYSSTERLVNKEFKSNMNGNGQFYAIKEPLHDFPSIAAGLLKYKKHEWIMIGFEKQQFIELLWINKGYDNSSVGLKLDFSDIVSIAYKKGYSSIMVFHNHPNSDPNRYNCTNPSQQDIRSAESCWNLCKMNNLNLLEFICERGAVYRYFLKVSDSLYSYESIVDEIVKENGKSKNQNYKLHMERRRLSNLTYDIG